MLQATNTATAQWNCDEEDYCWVYNPDITDGCGSYVGSFETLTMQFGLIELQMPPQTYTQTMNNQTCFAWIGQSDDDSEVHLGWKFMVDYSMEFDYSNNNIKIATLSTNGLASLHQKVSGGATVGIIAGCAAVVVLGAIGFKVYKAKQAKKAQTDAVYSDHLQQTA